MPTIRQSIPTQATPWQLWQALTHPDLVPRWAGVFMEGMYAESDWRTGGKVVWRTEGEAGGMRGKVIEAQPGRILHTTYPKGEMPGNAQAFDEIYKIEPLGGGVSRLSITCGPLDQEAYDNLSPLWEEALEVVRDLAEAEPEQAARRGREGRHVA